MLLMRLESYLFTHLLPANPCEKNRKSCYSIYDSVFCNYIIDVNDIFADKWTALYKVFIYRRPEATTSYAYVWIACMHFSKLTTWRGIFVSYLSVKFLFAKAMLKEKNYVHVMSLCMYYIYNMSAAVL